MSGLQLAMAAHAAVLGLAPLLAPGDAVPALLGPLDDLLASPDADAEGRAALAGLLCALGHALGSAVAEAELLPRVEALAADAAFAVRRVRSHGRPATLRARICRSAYCRGKMLGLGLL